MKEIEQILSSIKKLGTVESNILKILNETNNPISIPTLKKIYTNIFGNKYKTNLGYYQTLFLGIKRLLAKDLVREIEDDIHNKYSITLRGLIFYQNKRGKHEYRRRIRNSKREIV